MSVMRWKACLIRYGIGLIVSAVIAGCAGFPEPTKRAEMRALPGLEQTVASIWPTSPSGGRWPAQAWWESFEIAAMSRLIEIAVADNPDLKAVAARLRQTEALVDAQAAELYPTIEANVSFNAQRFSANSTQAKLAGEHFRQLLVNPLVLRYHLDLWGRDKAVLQAAIGKALAGQMELADARLILSVAVAQSYFELTASVEKLRLAELIVSCRERLLELAQAQLSAGVISSVPVLDAKTELYAARQQRAAVQAKVELQKNVLAVLAGKGTDWGRGIEVDSRFRLHPLPLPHDLPLHLLAHRPDVMAARFDVEAAAQDIEVARTAFYPDINLIAFAGLHSISISDVLLQGASLAYAVGPSVEFPIFEGGRLRANLSYREAAYDAAVERYNGRLLHAVQEVADALTLWQDIDTRLTEQQRIVATARESRSLAEALRRAGLTDLSALLQARADEYRQQFRLAILEGEYFKAAVFVIKALGGGRDQAAAL